VVETPQETKDDKQPVGTEQVDALVNTLKEAGIDTPDDLQGKLKASQQVGNMANELGKVREQNQQLLETIQKMQDNPAQNRQVDLDSMESGQPVDLQALMTRTVESVLDKRDQKNAQLQQANLQKYQKIISDRNYSKVKAIWEKKLQDPQFMFELNSGVKDPIDSYRDVVDEFKDGLLKQSLDTIQALSGQGKPPASPQIEEGGARVSQQLPPDDSESQETINKLQEKVEKGGKLSENEELDALTSVLSGQ
jgi:hypothetical protein